MKIWINGASRGLGYDVLKALDSNEHELVALTSFPSELEHFSNIEIIDKGIVISEIEGIIKKSIQNYGFPDVVIHTSGGGLGVKTPNINFEMFNSVFYKNFSHIIEINHSLISQKKESNDLKIIHIGSTAARQAIGSVSYNVAKSSLDSYVRSAGNQIQDKNIVLCGINLGAYLGFENSMERLRRNNKLESNKFINENLPLGKMMSIDSIFPLVNFLISSNISTLRGSMIPVDSGESKAYD